MIHGSTFVDQQMLNIVTTCRNIVVLLINNYTFWREVEMADEEMLLSLGASSVVFFKATGRLTVNEEEKS